MNDDIDAIELLYESVRRCPKCNGPMSRHDDEEKAKKGYKICPKCGITYSPEGTKGMSAGMVDGKIKMGKGNVWKDK